MSESDSSWDEERIEREIEERAERHFAELVERSRTFDRRGDHQPSAFAQQHATGRRSGDERDPPDQRPQ